MSWRFLITFGISIIVLVLAAAGYVIYGVHNRGPLILPPGTTATSTGGFLQATSTLNASTTASRITLPMATTTINTVSWPMHVDTELGYSIEYPPNLLPSVHEGVFTLAVPKNIYFHWPLEDDVKITVTATPSCPTLRLGEPVVPPIEYVLNGRTFTRSIGTDVGAGNRYLEIADDTRAEGICYRVQLLDHGTNGAGFYVDNRSLIQKYDAQHEADILAVISLYNAMISSLKVLASPL